MPTSWILVCTIGLLAGGFSAMTRVATPLIIIPVVVVGLGVDVRSAIAAALVTVIATTANSAGAYLRTGCQNIQVAIFAVVAAALGLTRLK